VALPPDVRKGSAFPTLAQEIPGGYASLSPRHSLGEESVNGTTERQSLSAHRAAKPLLVDPSPRVLSRQRHDLLGRVFHSIRNGKPQP
jgi:hypothetical protein